MPDDSGPIGRRQLAAIAGHLGRVDEARRHLRDHDPAVRSTALRALSRAGDLIAEELASALEDASPDVRIAALEIAADRGDVSVATTAARLDDPDSRVVEAAAWACGEMLSEDLPSDARPAGSASPASAAPALGPPVAAVVEELGRLARTHSDALCRESAIAALGAIGDRGGLEAILAGLEDKPAVRRRAVIALAPFDGPEVEAALARAGNDRDRQVRAAAAELGAAGPVDLDRSGPSA